MDKENKKPGRVWYLLAMFISLIGLSIAIYLLVKGINQLTTEYVQYKVPGGYEVSFPKSGDYSVFYEYQSILGDTGESLPNITCSLKNITTGQEIVLSRVSLSSLYKFQNRIGIEAWRFSIVAPGQYTFSAGYLPEKKVPEIILTIGREYSSAFWGMIIPPIKILAVFECVSLLIFLITFIWRIRTDRFKKIVLGILFVLLAAAVLTWILIAKVTPQLPASNPPSAESASPETKIIISEKAPLTKETEIATPEKIPVNYELENEAKEYVDDLAYLFFDSWNTADIKSQLIPESYWIKRSLDRTAVRLSEQLGYLKEYLGSIGSVTINREEISGNYKASAIFEKGSTEMNFSIVKRGEEWRIKGISVR